MSGIGTRAESGADGDAGRTAAAAAEAEAAAVAEAAVAAAEAEAVAGTAAAAAAEPAAPGEPASLDLGVVGNCAVAALIDTRARVMWACMPRFDGDPVFAGLLEGSRPESERSLFEVEIEGFTASEQTYRNNTPVLVTTLRDREGRELEVTDFAPRFVHFGRRFRPMALVRILRPVKGQPRIRIRIRPRFGNSAHPAEVTHGSNHVRYTGSNLAVRLTTNAPLAYLLNESWFYLEEELTLYLGPDESLSRPVAETGREDLDATTAYWREWVRHLHVPLEWQEAVIRAAITLKLCSFEETGAIVAAITTSVPEAPDSGRNWDYRYCWVRDAYYVIKALNELGAVDMMESHLRYVRNLVAAAGVDGHIQPVSGIDLRPALTERVADSLPGYRDMGPVRVGNDAYTHVQHDVYGQVVLSSAQAFFDHRLLRPMGERDFLALERVGERAFEIHREPDAGLWEFRNRARVHTYSSLMCWAACDRLAKIADYLGHAVRAAFWRERADTIRRFIEEEAWNPRLNSYTAAIGSEDLDASLLILADIGFHEPAHPRFEGTLKAIEAGLLHGNHMYRYTAEDDFGRPRTAFNVCTFWYIDALAARGETARARALFEGMLASRNHAGLLSEDIDTATGELWGNYPQTYSLVGIINGAVRLSRPWTAAR